MNIRQLQEVNDRKRVVVTGLGVIAPNGIGKELFWKNTMNGKSGVREIDRFPLNGFNARIAGLVDDFDPEKLGISEKDSERLDRYAQFAVAAAKMAIEDADLIYSEINKDRIGVNIANAICGTRYMEDNFLEMTDYGKGRLDHNWAQQALYHASTFNVASSEVASIYGFRGPCSTMATGCTAGLDALGFSLDVIRDGHADIMVTGASEAPITPIAMAAFDVIGALSDKRNHTPSKASRPFGLDRDGFVLAEGCGILILEELNHAIRRGATIYAEVRGFGSTCNAYHMTDLPADGQDLARAIQIALQDSCIAPHEIDYISAHGSSTRQNDTNETAAYKSVLGKHAYRVPISSLKSMTGHPLAGANAIESVAAAMGIRTNQIPPTINYETSDPNCDLNYVPNEGFESEVNVVLKNASGFSGIHSAVVFTKPEYEGASL